VVVIGGLVGLWRWRGDRRDAQVKVLKDQQSEREKRAEERFQAVVAGLGLLFSFGRFCVQGMSHFYTQTFDGCFVVLPPQMLNPPSFIGGITTTDYSWRYLYKEEGICF
jgi:hypothetical protein